MADNLELQLLNAVVQQGNVAALLSAQQHLVAYDREADFILREYAASKKLPSPEAVDLAFPGFSAVTVTEPADFYLRQVLDRRSRIDLQNFIADANRLLRTSPSAEEVTRLMMSAPIADHSATSLLKWDGSDRVAAYLANRSRKNVVTDFPWPTINTMCGELRRGHYMALCGRPKMGKTLIGQCVVYHAWRSGIEPLVLSGEMTVEEMQGRFDCIDAKVDLGRHYRGTLHVRDTMRLLRAIRRRQKISHGILFQDRDLYSLADVQASVASTGCPLVFVDGAYLFEGGLSGRNPTEKMVQISRTLKRIAKRFNVALVATFQQNRQAEGKKEGGGAATISWGDTVLMDADIIFEVFSADRHDRFRKLQSLGSRNSAGGSCVLNYRPSPDCDFSESNVVFQWSAEE